MRLRCQDSAGGRGPLPEQGPGLSVRLSQSPEGAGARGCWRLYQLNGKTALESRGPQPPCSVMLVHCHPRACAALAQPAPGPVPSSACLLPSLPLPKSPPCLNPSNPNLPLTGSPVLQAPESCQAQHPLLLCPTGLRAALHTHIWSWLLGPLLTPPHTPRAVCA